MSESGLRLPCTLYETEDGFIYVARVVADDDQVPLPLSPLFMSTEVARQWMREHPDACSDAEVPNDG